MSAGNGGRPHGRRSWIRLSIAVDKTVALEARDLAICHDVPLSRLFEEAMREYLATRRCTSSVQELLAVVPTGRMGRPSRFDRLALARRAMGLHRREGRRLKSLRTECEP